MRVRRGFLRIAAVLSLLTGLTGCWANQSVDYRAIVLGIGFAPASHGRLAITVQVPTRNGLTGLTGANASASASGPSVYTMTESGKTVGTGLVQIQGQTQDELYVGQVQLIAFSSRLDAKQVKLAENWLAQIGPLDKTAYVVATPHVRALFQKEPATGTLSTLQMLGGFSCVDCGVVTFRQHQWDLSIESLSPGYSLWMPYVTLTPTGFTSDRITVFRQEQPVWTLSPAETTNLGYVMGTTARGYLTVTENGEPVGIRFISASPHIRARIQNGRVHIDVTLKAAGTIDTLLRPTLSPQPLAQIEHQSERELAKQVLRVLTRLQRLGSDPNGFLAPLIWQSEPSWEDVSTWEQAYRQADITVHVVFRIKDIGDVG